MPLSAKDAADWQALQPPKTRGKPTPEQIEERKNLAARGAAFLKALCEREGQPEPALKKQLNKMLKDADLAAKAAAKAEKAASAKGKKKEDDEEVDPTKYRENRLKEAAALQEAGIPPLPHKFAEALGPSWMPIRIFREKYDDPSVTVAGEKLDGTHMDSRHRACALD